MCCKLYGFSFGFCDPLKMAILLKITVLNRLVHCHLLGNGSSMTEELFGSIRNSVTLFLDVEVS